MSAIKRSMVISFIGRPNVGKSSLFNRLLRKSSKALTHDEPGVTRDRHYGIATFSDDDDDEDESAERTPNQAILVDTGGFYPEQISEEGGTDSQQKANKFFNIMTEHAHLAIEESDLVLFVVDVREGLLPFDHGIADFIRSKKKKMWLLVNKYDTEKQAGEEAEFYSIGIDGEDLITVSAAHGGGINGLREKIEKEIISFNKITKDKKQLQEGVTPNSQVVSRLALIGAPNAGKSTLLNKFIGAERALVSDIAGTTVDPIEGYFDLFFGKGASDIKGEVLFPRSNKVILNQYEDFQKNNPNILARLDSQYAVEESLKGEFSADELPIAQIRAKLKSEAELYDEVFGEDEAETLEAEKIEEVVEAIEEQEDDDGWRSIHLVDTAGIRRQKSVEGFIETQSVYRSLRCITESDIVIHLVDATKGISHQDRRLLGIALEKGKSVIVALNKIDLLKETLPDESARKEWLLDLRDKIPWLDYCDLIPISAKNGKGIKPLKNAIISTVLIRRRSIPTSHLNKVVLDLIERNPVVIKRGRGERLKVRYASMIKSSPPTFLLFTNKSLGIPEHYKRYLKNGLRKEFHISNTPVHLLFRTGSDLAKR